MTIFQVSLQKIGSNVLPKYYPIEADNIKDAIEKYVANILKGDQNKVERLDYMDYRYGDNYQFFFKTPEELAREQKERGYVPAKGVKPAENHYRISMKSGATTFHHSVSAPDAYEAVQVFLAVRGKTEKNISEFLAQVDNKYYYGGEEIFVEKRTEREWKPEELKQEGAALTVARTFEDGQTVIYFETDGVYTLAKVNRLSGIDFDEHMKPTFYYYITQVHNDATFQASGDRLMSMTYFSGHLKRLTRD